MRYIGSRFGCTAEMQSYDDRTWPFMSVSRLGSGATQLCMAVYSRTNTWPTAERYGLTSQARRAAHSAAANIAEGCAKKGPKEFRRYLDISLGSLSELSYTLRLARDLNILTQEEWLELDELHQKAGGITWLLYKSLLAKKITSSSYLPVLPVLPALPVTPSDEPEVPSVRPEEQGSERG